MQIIFNFPAFCLTLVRDTLIHPHWLNEYKQEEAWVMRLSIRSCIKKKAQRPEWIHIHFKYREYAQPYSSSVHTASIQPGH